MPDYGQMFADQTVAEIAKRLRKIYDQAAKELRLKFADFQRKHQAKQLEKLDQLKDGKITKSEYDSWMMGQLFIGKQWQDKIDQAVRIMHNANQTATDIVNKGRFDVFAENYNYSSFLLDKHFRADMGFNLFSTEAVSRLIKKAPKLLPEWKIDKAKDYIWNHSKLVNSITQGIIQGERLDRIVVRLIKDLVTQNWNRMKTFARTAITGAQNAGREQQMQEAEEMGIKGKKKWIATLDDRTRDTHQELDGDEVAVGKPFKVMVKNKMEEIMYPGDPNALPCLVYNCRCTMIEVYDGITRKQDRRAYEIDEKGYRKSYIVHDMNYKQWKAWKESRNGGK